MIDPVSLASITSAIAVLGNDYLKGVASEAGKSTWNQVKALLGWSSDPAPAEIPEKVAAAVKDSPDITERLLELLKNSPPLVGKITVGSGGKVVVIGTAQNVIA